MNLWITGQSQNKWGMVLTVNEQKEHKFESIKPILQVYLQENFTCNWENKHVDHFKMYQTVIFTRCNFKDSSFYGFNMIKVEQPVSNHLPW